MSVDLPGLRAALAERGRIARVVVADVAGSVPREAGAAMLVWPEGQSGTIGGGALEYEAAARARAVLAGESAPGATRCPLGPSLGQCCGGSVTLLTEVIDQPLVDRIAEGGPVWARPATPDLPLPLAVERLKARPAEAGPVDPQWVDGWMVEPVAPAQNLLWVHGAGHVGRAIVHTIAPLPDWAITWVDTDAERFPDPVPLGVDVLVARDPARAVSHAPVRAHHLVITYSHALDLALCDALLRRGFATAGLIGSATKWARFSKRLRAAGHDAPDIARIACPIGDRDLGRHPQGIAIGVAAALIRAAAAFAAEDEERRA
ncbi:MAG: xanthine dehydrogenase accessory protein XdhC [Pseudomonadota bacterium]